MRRPRFAASVVRLLLLAALLYPACRVRAGGAPAAPVTVHTRVELPAESEVKGLDGVWLAGLGAGADAPPTALAVVWAQGGGFFPVWTLQLQSDAGLLPQGVPAAPGTGVLSGSQTFPLPGVTSPRWGHVYETVLSYDPATGAMSLWIYDATADETLFAGEYLGGRTDRALTAGAGVQRGRVFTAAQDVEAAAVYVPRGVTWRIVELAGGAPGASVSRVHRDVTEAIAIYLDVAGRPDGTLRVLAERDGGVEEWLVLAQPSGAFVAPVPPERLAAGVIRLVLEYADAAGHVWFREAKTLEVGHLWADFEPAVFVPSEGYVRGGVTVRADAPEEVALRITGRLTKMEWDPGRRAYMAQEAGTFVIYDAVTALAPEPVYLPLAAAAPGGEPALGRIDFAVEAARGVPSTLSGATRMFTTYRAAEGVEEGPFTLVVLPDTQYQTHLSPQGGDPVILTRMMHWIAEKAAEERIGLVLHVGDVTDHNRSNEWEVAQNALALLDGVVPYVLAVGNHDLGTGGNSANRETLLNQYFPVARYAGAPWFGGTFEEGRLENSYHVFRLGGEDYLALSLEFLPRDEVLAWAGDVVAAHPDHKVLLVTHTYTSVSGSQRSVYGERYGITQTGNVNTGVDIWEKLVSRYPNMLMVFSGHVTPDGTLPRQVKIGAAGQRVYEMLVNFQHRTRGGDGWLALLRFTPGSPLVGVELYSPYLGAYRVDRSGAFGVPFCIDLTSPYHVPIDAACPVLPERDAVVTAW